MARITTSLTNTEVAKAKAKDKPYRLYDGGGLLLNITDKGTKTWYLQYKKPYTGKADMYKMGRYPAISLADARVMRQDCEKLLEQNIDPKAHYKELEDTERNKIANDFKSVFEEWAPTKKYDPKTLEKTQGYVEEIMAVIGNKPVSKITTQDCMAVLKPVEAKGHYTKLQKMRTKINQVMAYAIATGRATQNPAIHLRGVFKTGDTKHAPAILDEPRLAQLVKAIDNYHGLRVTTCAVKFALTTFARPGEVRQLRWAEINLNDATWTYTPPKTQKSTGVKMVSPLSRQAMDILLEMREYSDGEYVFPSLVSESGLLSTSTFNQALDRMGFDNTEQTSQGFRAMARTILEERLKYPYELIDMQLAHKVVDSNGRAYNRVRWIEERKELMQSWADYLDELKAKF